MASHMLRFYARAQHCEKRLITLLWLSVSVCPSMWNNSDFHEIFILNTIFGKKLLNVKCVF
jgi:hypothetical protein